MGEPTMKIIPEDKARQGRWGRHGLRILIAALLLAFVAWGIAEIYGEMIDTNTPADQDQAPAG
ncbi:hypothetical protein GCM10007880_24100 [Mesorhizobium amorphae]|uniref:Uncharacterized protein n=2 Tax=Phyllobacteriaceae TaxID=69277 RepID=G6YDX2_9HYPH|nr:hypothetical protein A6B35_01230 [Mesorhizobium amorphae CCNWGS0123]EHH10045.1 hypothetical protein MEA186_20824 [Mesorhizobium amorphae CCNWGS0123]GLR41894.1 hypothetical protein GCM10007880_24100 [Mesorhizobium amorphae]